MRLTFAVLLALVVAATARAADPPRRNVVLLVADDLGRTLGCCGDAAARTPNIDALARDGTRFPFAFATVASCSPSRSVLLTGRHTHSSGQYGLAHATHNFHTRPQVRGLPKLLAAAGYRSGVVGKLHVIPREVYPFDAELPGGRDVQAISRNARKFISDSGDKPFFLLVGYADPHRAGRGFGNDRPYPGAPEVRYDPRAVPLPYHLPDLPAVRRDLADYYQSVSRMDHGVGLVRRVLQETGRAGDTLVIFLSDNGIPFPGAKTTLYDAGVHLPLIVAAPGRKAGVTCRGMASWVDITPTILDWAGVNPPEDLPGRSLLPVLEQENPPGRDVVFGSHQFHEVTMYYPMRMVRTRTHKLIVNLAHPLEYPFASDLFESPSWQALREHSNARLGQRDLRAFLHRPKEELYDLTADPNELKNVADDPNHAAALAELRQRLKAWQRQTQDPWLIKDKHE
jgi:N-sulfoglucosamine sulfohydrolase